MKQAKEVESPYRLALSDVVRIANDCAAEIAKLIDGSTITIEGRECKLKAKSSGDEILFNILSPTDNVHSVEFRAIYSGRFDYDKTDVEVG